MLTVTQGRWKAWIKDGDLPGIYSSYLEHASFVDQIDIDNSEGRFFVLGVCNGEKPNGWPPIIIAQKYQNADVFHPSFIVVPETSLVFVGAGETILCYDIAKQKRLWKEPVDMGFWGWDQSGSYIMMSSELEFGVYTNKGVRLWSTFVEPPWNFRISGQNVELDVMGDIRIHRLADGEKKK